VALTIGAVVVLLAHRLFSGVVDGTARLTEARRALDREANARRSLDQAFGSLAVGEGSGPFTGRPHQVEFTTWQVDEHGWLRRHSIRLGQLGDSLIAASPSATIVLDDRIAGIDFDYLLDAGNGDTGDTVSGAPGATARFVREWISPVSAPIAVRIRIAHREPGTGEEGTGSGGRGAVDTVLVIVGPRG
jgi:hypothetical protein